RSLQVAGVEVFPRDHAGILPKPVMQLVGPTIQGIDPGGAPLQKAIRKPAGGGADVQTDLVLRREAEMMQGLRQLDATSSDIGMIWAFDTARARFREALARFVDSGLVDHHFSRQDQGLGPFPRRR